MTSDVLTSEIEPQGVEHGRIVVHQRDVDRLSHGATALVMGNAVTDASVRENLAIGSVK